jgi:hypothetical protein
MVAARWIALACSSAFALVVACSGADGGDATVDPTTLAAEDGGASASSGSSGASSSGASSGGASSGGGDGTGDGGGAGSSGDAAAPSACTSAATEPQAAATIGGWLDALPYGNPTGAAKTEVVEAILRACHVFTPTSATFTKRHCWAHLVAAILKESSYDAALLGKDAYSKRAIGNQTANDPSVGLLQIRFSSTVKDYALLGRLDPMACIGCDIPPVLVQNATQSGDSAFWAVTGPTQYMSLMQKRACNVGFGAWYYYENATGNGSASKTTYAEEYCAGQGTAANLVTGLRSHLRGPDLGRGVVGSMAGVNALQATDPDSYAYVTEIKTRFDGMVGAVNGTHPFFVLLQPEKPRYCK